MLSAITLSSSGALTPKIFPIMTLCCGVGAGSVCACGGWEVRGWGAISDVGYRAGRCVGVLGSHRPWETQLPGTTDRGLSVNLPQRTFMTTNSGLQLSFSGNVAFCSGVSRSSLTCATTPTAASTKAHACVCVDAHACVRVRACTCMCACVRAFACECAAGHSPARCAT